MDNKSKSQKSDEKDESKMPIGKRHDENDNKPNTDKQKKGAFNKKEMADADDDNVTENSPERKRIDIDDNPEETERKIPRMKH